MVRGRLAAGGALLAAAMLVPASHAQTDEQQAKTAALQFGRALTRADTSALNPVLPSRGKVKLILNCFGPEEGSYSADQVRALFKDFLREGQVRSFDLLRISCASEQFALVHARTRVTDRDGRPREVELRLTFQPEDDLWVLREIRETQP
jgi:hypothetical protein